jgi:hypothetical protein
LPPEYLPVLIKAWALGGRGEIGELAKFASELVLKAFAIMGFLAMLAPAEERRQGGWRVGLFGRLISNEPL